MNDILEFTAEERQQALTLYSEVKEKIASSLEAGD